MEEKTTKVLKLSDAIKVQEEAVISRTLINQPAGTVTLFGFDQGQSLSEHTAPYDAMVIGIEGQGEVTISGKTYEINSCESILMPANHPHSLKAISPFKMMLVMIKG